MYNCTYVNCGEYLTQITVDTSTVIAVMLNEPEKAKLIELTEDHIVIAPHSLHWEIGNAFSAMFKRNRLSLIEAISALKVYDMIPIQFVDIKLSDALKLAESENIYTYDAYFLICAIKHRTPLLTLDDRLKSAAINKKIKALEV